MGESTAFIFLDIGIRDSIDSFPESQQIRFDLEYKCPRTDGLPTDGEFEDVNAIEDRIEEFSDIHSGIYVGRVTTAGRRYFYTFNSATSEVVNDFVHSILQSTEYRIEYRLLDDPDKKGYWSDLYPTELDWRVIWDSRVIEALRESGDNNEIVRRIDHWAFFGAKKDAQLFLDWCKGEGFALQDMRRTKPLIGDWVVQVHRNDAPNSKTINSVTIGLLKKAKELNGKYDGWETSVEKGSDSDES
jgi:hypothetical protein